MTDRPTTNPDAPPLPDFAKPPLVEVALAAQFQPLFRLRPIELGALRDRWKTNYPHVQEQPTLPSISETESGLQTGVQLVVGPQMMSRLWFLSEDQSNLVQLQHDRLIVNWRAILPNVTYPRYPQVRSNFERSWTDLDQVVSERQLGELLINQVEVNYINSIQLPPEELGQLDRVLKNWRETSGDRLGNPEQARLALVFRVRDIGTGPVRLYIAVDRGQPPGGTDSLFLTLTVRGAPSGPTLQSALDFMDRAHEDVVRSFAELTTDSMHRVWERQR